MLLLENASFLPSFQAFEFDAEHKGSFFHGSESGVDQSVVFLRIGEDTVFAADYYGILVRLLFYKRIWI